MRDLILACAATIAPTRETTLLAAGLGFITGIVHIFVRYNNFNFLCDYLDAEMLYHFCQGAWSCSHLLPLSVIRLTVALGSGVFSAAIAATFVYFARLVFAGLNRLAKP
jgi:hypothetical protein